MKKQILHIITILVCCQIGQSQTKREFNELETYWISDTIVPTNIDEHNPLIISETEFLKHKAKNKASVQENPNVTIDSTGLFVVQTKNYEYNLYQTQDYSSSYNYIGFVPDIKSHLIGFCGGGTCANYLLDNEFDIKLKLNSNYDAGLIELKTSPNSKLIALLSSYDGSDFENYYEYRAIIEILEIRKDNSIKGIKHKYFLTSQEFSISEIVWIDNQTIAFKGYSSNRLPRTEKDYDYLKIKL
jgi:hypothetical protein